MKKEAIIILSSYQSQYSGSFIYHLRALGEKILLNNYNLIYIFPPSAKEKKWINLLNIKNTKIIYIDNVGNKIKIAKALKKILKEENVKIVYTHFSAYDVPVAIATKFKNIKTCYHVHSDFTAGEKESFKKRVKNKIRSLLFAKGAYYISESQDILRKIKSKNKMHIPNSLVTQRETDYKIQSKEEIRKKIGINKDIKLILIFGWAGKVKGVDIALNAVKELNKIDNKIKLGLVCADINKSKEYIESSTKYKGDDESIIYIKQQEDVFSLIKSSDVFLSASRSEGFSFSLLEALYVGVNVVSSIIPGTSWVQNFKKVKTYPVESIEECRRAIKYALENPITDGENIENRAEIEEKYSLDKMVDITFDYLTKQS